MGWTRVIIAISYLITPILVAFVITRSLLARAREKDGYDKRLYEVAFYNASIGMALVNKSTGGIEDCNHALAEFLGQSREDLIEGAVTFMDVTHPDDLAIDLNLFTDVINGVRRQYRIKKRYVMLDGTIKWGHLNVTSVSDDMLEVVVGQVVDIDELEKAKDELMRVNDENTRLINAMRSQSLISLRDAPAAR